MRQIPFALLLVSAIASAAPPPAEFDQAKFEKRFRAADKNQNGKLSRDEAYAAFPRAPEFFDELDGNRDGSITLGEVKKAADKRVDAAVNASKTGSRYRLPAEPGVATVTPGAGSEVSPSTFASREEARRYHRYDYYESLADEREAEKLRGQPTPNVEPVPALKKSF